VNNREVKQVYTPVMWKIKVPPRIHIFLWLLANNKVLTRDNLAKRRQVDDQTYLFCKEQESVAHLFFECCVAQNLWEHVSKITGLPVIRDFTSLGKFWVMGGKHGEFNVLTSAMLWTLRKSRNDLCFQGLCWTNVEKILGRCAVLLRNWAVLNKPGEMLRLEEWTQVLEKKSSSPPMLPWWRGRDSGSTSDAGYDEDVIASIMRVVSSVIPVTNEWWCESAAQLRSLPDTLNLNVRFVSE
jgi:hypothetical protein